MLKYLCQYSSRTKSFSRIKLKAIVVPKVWKLGKYNTFDNNINNV